MNPKTVIITYPIENGSETTIFYEPTPIVKYVILFKCVCVCVCMCVCACVRACLRATLLQLLKSLKGLPLKTVNLNRLFCLLTIVEDTTFRENKWNINLK